MTYPPQQPAYAPQQYQTYGQTPGYAPGQQYLVPPQTPQQHAAQPSQGGQTLPTQAPTLGQSGRTGGATAPAPRHLVGRTVIFEPIRIDDTTTAQVKDPVTKQMVTVNRPTAHYNLTVVDGGLLQYGDNKSDDVSKQHGMTFEVQTPCRFTNVSSDRFGIVNEVRDAIARGDQGSVGVIVQGTQGNRPFLVTKPGRDLDGKDRPDGDQRFQAAMDVWNRIWNKDLSWNPTPRSLVAPPAQQPPQVAYQPTPQGYAVAQQGITQPYPYGAAPAQQLHPEYVAAATQPGYDPQAFAGFAPAPAQQPAMDPGYAAYLAAQQVQQQPAPVPQSAPPVDPQYAAWLASQQAQQQGGPGI